MSQHHNYVDFDSTQALDLTLPACDLLPAGLLQTDESTEIMESKAHINDEYGDEPQPQSLRPADDNSMETDKRQIAEPLSNIASISDSNQLVTHHVTFPIDATQTQPATATPGPEFRPRLRIQYDPQPSASPRRKKGMSGKVRHSLLLALQALTSGKNPDSSLPSINVEADSLGPTYRSDVVLLRRLEEARPVHRLRRPTRLARQLVLLARDVKSDPNTVRTRLLMLADEAETLDLTLDVPDFRVLGERGIRLALVHGGADWVGLRSLPNDILCHVKYELRFIVGASAIAATAPQSTVANSISTGPLASPTGYTPDFTTSESSSAFTPTTSGSGSTLASSVMSGTTSPKLLDRGTIDRFGNPSTANSVPLVSSPDAEPLQSTKGSKVVELTTNETTKDPPLLPSETAVAPEPPGFVPITTSDPQDNGGGLDSERSGRCPSSSDSNSTSDVISCPTRDDVGAAQAPQLAMYKSGHVTAPTSDSGCSEKSGYLASNSGTESTVATEADDAVVNSKQLNLNMSMNTDEDRHGTTATAAEANYEMDGIEVDFKLNTTTIPQPQQMESTSPPSCKPRDIFGSSIKQAEHIYGLGTEELKYKEDFERDQGNTEVEKHKRGNAKSPLEQDGNDKTLCRVSMDMNIEVSSNLCSYQHIEVQAVERRHSFGAVEADRRRRKERCNLERDRLKQEHQDVQKNVQEIISGLEKALKGLRKRAGELERQLESVARTNACECECNCKAS